MAKGITKSYLLDCLKNFYTKKIIPLFATKMDRLTQGLGISISRNAVSGSTTISASPDSALSTSSLNGVQNKVAKAALDAKQTIKYIDMDKSNAINLYGNNGFCYGHLDVPSALPSGVTMADVVNAQILYWDKNRVILGSDWGGTSDHPGDIQVICDSNTPPNPFYVRIFYVAKG